MIVINYITITDYLYLRHKAFNNEYEQNNVTNTVNIC